MKKLCLITISAGLMAARLAAQTLPAAPAVPDPLVQPPHRPGLEIFSDTGNLDLRSKSLMYSNNVVLIDQPLNPGDAATVVRCRVLTRTVESNYNKIVAEGDVQIDQGDLHARGQLAVYTSETERLELTGPFGNSQFPMLYTTPGTNANTTIITNYGETIIYDRRNAKLKIDKIRTLVDPRTLSRGTNGGGGNILDMRPRGEPPAGASKQPSPGAEPSKPNTNRIRFSTSPSTRPSSPKGGQ